MISLNRETARRFLAHFVPALLIGTALSQVAAAQTSTVPPLGHVVVVALENHSFSEVVGSSAMPYYNSLISQNALATNFFATSHGSLSEYFALTDGELVTLDDSYSANVSIDNIVRELSKANKTWKSYAESIPSTGYTGGDVYPYVRHHNPFTYFTDVLNSSSEKGNLVSLSQFSSDVSAGSLPNFSFVVPDNEHNGHDCPDGSSNCTDATKLQAVDQFLQANIGPVLNSAQFQKDGLLVIWWDEGDLSDSTQGGGQVAVMLAGPYVKKGFQSNTFYRHAHLLRTIAEALGLPGYPGATQFVPSMAEFFTTTASVPSGSGAISGHVSDITTGVSISGATVSYSGGSTTSDGSGNFSFANVAGGTYTVSASASGYFTETTTAAVSGGTATANVELPTGAVISGTITSSAGGAISGATVTVSGGSVATTKTVTTDSSGAYSTSWIPVGSYTVSVSASGYGSNSQTTNSTTGQTTTVNLALSATSTPTNTSPGAVSGRITDISNGSSISGATVTLGSASTTTNSTGNYSFSSVTAGSYTLTAKVSGYFTVTNTVNVTAGTTSTDNVQMATGGKLAGTVTTTSGAAISGATVTISGGLIPNTVTVTTNSSGVYNSSWVPVGNYTVTVSASGHTSQSNSTAVKTGATTTDNFSLQ